MALPKRMLALAGMTLALAAGSGGAFAATQGGSNSPTPNGTTTAPSTTQSQTPHHCDHSGSTSA